MFAKMIMWIFYDDIVVTEIEVDQFVIKKEVIILKQNPEKLDDIQVYK